MSKQREHEGERFVRLLEEQFEKDLEMLDNFLKIDGREMFTTKLSNEEMMAWWMDLPRRVAMLESVHADQGPEGVKKVEAEMRAKEAAYRGQIAGVSNG